MNSPLSVWRGFSIPARVLLVMGCLGIIVKTINLAQRVGHSQTDVSVFYRMAVAMQGGVAPEFYGELDTLTNWPRCYPPSGTIFTAWMPQFSLQGAVVVWSLLKFGLLLLAGYGLWQYAFGSLVS